MWAVDRAVAARPFCAGDAAFRFPIFLLHRALDFRAADHGPDFAGDETGAHGHRRHVVRQSAAAIDDVIGWLMLGVATVLATSGFEWRAFLLQIMEIAAFFFCCSGSSGRR